MDFDNVTQKLGQFGKYQRIMFAIMSLYSAQIAFNNLGIVFLAGTPDHWCKSPELESFNFTSGDIKGLTIPLVEKDGQTVFSSCERYSEQNFNFSTEEKLGEFLQNGTIEKCQDGWNYDTSVYTSTVVSQWDLVCDHRWLKATGSSVYMAGLCIGVIVSTALSDIIGRRPIILVTLPLNLVASIASSFSPNYITFCVFRFLIAFLVFGQYTCCFVMVMELIGPDYRMHAGIAMEYSWAAGYLTFAGIAYFIRDWATLNLIASCSCVPLILTLFFLPESPRWLYVHGQTEKADIIVKKIAKFNKVELSETIIVDIKHEKKGYLWDLFRTSRMACRSVNMCYLWFATSVVYYGLSLNTSNLGGNDYVNFAIAGAIEFPAYFMSQLTLHYLGRRIPLCMFMITGGVALLCTLAVPTEMNWLVITLCMTGKFGVTAAFAVLYVYAAELYPTTVRSIGLGTSSCSARIGGIIAPFIGQLSDISKLIPMIIFGVMALSAGLLALLFPETRGKQLPETLKDGEKFGRKSQNQVEGKGTANTTFMNSND